MCRNWQLITDLDGKWRNWDGKIQQNLAEGSITTIQNWKTKKIVKKNLQYESTELEESVSLRIWCRKSHTTVSLRTELALSQGIVLSTGNSAPSMSRLKEARFSFNLETWQKKIGFVNQEFALEEPTISWPTSFFYSSSADINYVKGTFSPDKIE